MAQLVWRWSCSADRVPVVVRIPADECALNAVATAVIFTFDHFSPPVSPFMRFSPLSLRHGVVVVCFEVFG